MPRPMICLNSVMELMTRARTMFLQVDVHAGGEQLRGCEDGRSAWSRAPEAVEMAAPDVAFVGGDADNIIRVLLHQIGVEIVQRVAHLVGVFLVDAEDDGLGEAVGLFQEVGEVAGDGFGARQQERRCARNPWCCIRRRESRGHSGQARPCFGRQPAASHCVTMRWTR